MTSLTPQERDALARIERELEDAKEERFASRSWPVSSDTDDDAAGNLLTPAGEAVRIPGVWIVCVYVTAAVVGAGIGWWLATRSTSRSR